ncbi:MAG: flavodoxin domain-containing protein [Clostridiales bacterium]|jgi:menaquinone-dependent protoporphyrinogen IX oxidase|nr:flavodoxin domain-containing protein [Clostridiales bacterium]
MKSILIAYVTKTGTTLHAAKIIAEVFELNGYTVEIKKIGDEIRLGDYFGIIIGAPINGMQWHPDAVSFITENQQILKEKAVAYYFMSYILNVGNSFWNKRIQTSLNKVKNIVKPENIGMFNGRVGSDFPAVARWIFGIKKGTPMNLTDDLEVKEWAEECCEIFDRL